MRVLTTSVLVFEWIVLALAIPVAVNTAGVAPGTAWAVFGLVTILGILAIGMMSRPAGVWLGWGVQVIAIASGLVVGLLGIMGAIFAALYLAAIRMGRQVDEAKARNAAAQAMESQHEKERTA